VSPLLLEQGKAALAAGGSSSRSPRAGPSQSRSVPARRLLVFLGTLLYAYAEALVKLLLPAKRKAVRGELVLVTGAARGLGRATAREFARHQSRLVLWDVEAVRPGPRCS